MKAPEVAPEVTPSPVGAKVTGVGGTAVPDGHSVGAGQRSAHAEGDRAVGDPPVALPVTVAASVTVPLGPMTTEPGEAVVVVNEVAAVTLKHSVSLCWGTLS